MKININRLLENSKRTSLIGKNIYTYEGYEKDGKWLSPLPGFRTHMRKNEMNFGICIGHQIENVTEAVYPEFFEEGNKLRFSCVRHRWTPAWQETYYRSEPDSSYYPNSGCISFCETKCITENDVFCSRIVLRSDKRKPAEILVKLITPLNGKISFDIKIGALGAPIHAKGYVSITNSLSDSNEFVVTVPPNGEIVFSYSFAFSKNNVEAAETAAKMVLKKSNPFSEKEKFFNDFMKEFAPELIAENQDIMKVYYYRWFLIYRAIHLPSEVIHNHPIQRFCMYESPYGGWYGCPVGLPVPLHIEETKWMINPRFVYDNIENWIENKTNYQRYIQYTPMAIWSMYRNHPDKALMEKAYPVCREYALKCFNEEKEGLEFFPTLNSSWPTGAEYQPAFYQHTAIKWDWTQDLEGKRNGMATEDLLLYRLDYIVYSIGNLIGCMKIAEKLGKSEDYKYISGLKERAIKLLKTHFYSEKRNCFVSLDAKSGEQCDEAVCYDSFFPFLWNIVGDEYISGFAPLFEENGLSCPFGMTSVEKKCPMYWFDNCITGPTKSSVLEPHSYICCWNGPVWPYAVSTVAEALGSFAVGKDDLREKWIELFEKYTELHFMDGDRTTPMITEHYRPTDGQSFSATCDYFHSTWIDLFMKYWAGIKVTEIGVEISPFVEEEFVLKNVRIGNISYTFSQERKGGEYICNIYEI